MPTETIVSKLEFHASTRGDAIAFRFLDRGQVESASLSYAALYKEASSGALRLLKICHPGERVCLVFATGPEAVLAMTACLLAGLVVVPLPTPRPNRTQGHVLSVVVDCGCRMVLTSKELRQPLEDTLVELAKEIRPRVTTLGDIDDACAVELPAPGEDDLALVQYTSGSTSKPRGVCITHRNLVANQLAIRDAFGNGPDTIGVSWLPIHHDMGLIGMVIQPIYLGCQVVHMSPLAFIQRPYRWLQAISQYRGTTSGGPNFAYELCTRKVTEAQCEELDLSSWELAFNGAEAVRRDTLEQFYNRFKHVGLRREALYTCYGMAEATLFITGARLQDEPSPADSPGEPIHSSHAAIASSGCVQDSTDLKIVCPEALSELAPGAIGEIWVKGPGISPGYWEKPHLNQMQFNKHLATDESQRGYFRTGDLGYLQGGHLYVCGRLKEMLVVHGQNFFPVDLETAAAEADRRLSRDAIATFNGSDRGEETIVVAAEIRNCRTLSEQDSTAIRNAIREGIADNFDIAPKEIILLRPGAIPRTSSGKLKRLKTRELYLVGKLQDAVPASQTPNLAQTT